VFDERLAHVRERITQACQRCGRDPSSITLVAVTKGVTVPAIREAAAHGLMDFGENRVQEARRKYQELVHSPQSTVHGVRWHLVGHLQRNKAKDAVVLFDAIHSVDTAALAQALEQHAAAAGKSLDIFMQVNVSGEATKFGCRPDEAAALAQVVRGLPHVRLAGLMTIAPFTEEAERSRQYFRQLRELRDRFHSAFHISHSALKLSMGMSQDFEVAIEEGADNIRVGTAIFGTGDGGHETKDG